MLLMLTGYCLHCVCRLCVKFGKQTTCRPSCYEKMNHKVSADISEHGGNDGVLGGH